MDGLIIRWLFIFIPLGFPLPKFIGPRWTNAKYCRQQRSSCAHEKCQWRRRCHPRPVGLAVETATWGNDQTASIRLWKFFLLGIGL